MIKAIKTEIELSKDDWDHPRHVFPYADYRWLHRTEINLDDFENWNISPHWNWNQNPWMAFQEDAGIDLHKVRLDVLTDCPHTGFSYYALVPWALITKCDWDTVNKIYNGYGHSDGLRNIHLSHLKLVRPETQMGGIARGIMGSGYLDGCCVHDGTASIVWNYLKLDNGDYLACYCWNWYNK